MKRPWRAAWLSPFAALQLIVVIREGENIAVRLRDYSAVARLALARSLDPDDVKACAAFNEAERDLTDWCMSGVIEAQGCRRGPNGQIGEPEDISRYWSDTRHLDVTNGTLSGNPFFSDVTLNNINVDIWASRDDNKETSDYLDGGLIDDDADALLRPVASDTLAAIDPTARDVERVIDQGDADRPLRTGLPGRPSSKEMCLEETRRRIENNEAFTTVKAEAEYLSNWLSREHPKYPKATSGALENNQELKALVRAWRKKNHEIK